MSIEKTVDDGILFGPKSGSKVVLSLMDGQLIRLDAFSIQSKIKIHLLDRDAGSANSGTGLKKPYTPCGPEKILDTENTTEYVRGPGVFEFENTGIPGMAYVKMVEVKSPIFYEEFCKKS